MLPLPGAELCRNMSFSDFARKSKFLVFSSFSISVVANAIMQLYAVYDSNKRVLLVLCFLCVLERASTFGLFAINYGVVAVRKSKQRKAFFIFFRKQRVEFLLP